MTALLLLSGYAVSALLLASAAVPPLRRLAPRAGLVDDPDDADYKTHRRVTPCAGGLAVWIGTSVPVGIAAGWLLGERPDLVHDGPGWIDPWAPFAFFPLESWSPTVLQVSQVLCLLAAATAVMLLGLADDRRPLPPPPRPCACAFRPRWAPPSCSGCPGSAWGFRAEARSWPRS